MKALEELIAEVEGMVEEHNALQDRVDKMAGMLTLAANRAEFDAERYERFAEERGEDEESGECRIASEVSRVLADCYRDALL